MYLQRFHFFTKLLDNHHTAHIPYRLLAERITLCWLELQYFQTIYAQHSGNLSITLSDYHQRRIDKAHRRYLSSIKALAQIRKMGPAVQINIAEKQINRSGQP
jgi:hypothetical protein